MSEIQKFEDNRWSFDEQRIVFRHRAALGLLAKGYKKILDVGCGDGLFLRLAEEIGLECTGFDQSSVGLEHARQRDVKSKLVLGDASDGLLPFNDNEFEAVCALDVLEHVMDPGKLLKEMKRVSNKAVVISVPNFSSFPARLQCLLGRIPENNRPNKGHVYWFNHDILMKMLMENGLTSIKIEMNHPWDKVFIVGLIIKFLSSIWPNLLALSYVVLAEEDDSAKLNKV